MILINSNTQDINFRKIPYHDNINTQFIISKNINGELIIWNFNADNYEKVMGKAHSLIDQLLGLSTDTMYKRIIPDKNLKKIQILEMTPEEIQNYNNQQKRNDKGTKNKTQVNCNSP
jgi:hypothetical protein